MATQQQKSYKILLLGDGCTDKYHFGRCDRLSPEAPVPVFKLIETKVMPGMALNVEKNLISFDIDVRTVSNENHLITKERFIDERSGQQLLRLDTGEDKSLDPLTVGGLDLSQYDCIVVSDYNKGILDYHNCETLSHMCKRINKLLFVDSKKTDLSCFEDAIIKINEKERELIEKLPNKYDMIVTLGEKGASWDGLHFPSDPTEVFDVSGAGDTFFAALISEYLSTNNIATSIIFANKCAATTVKKIGAYSLTNEEIREIRDGLYS